MDFATRRHDGFDDVPFAKLDPTEADWYGDLLHRLDATSQAAASPVDPECNLPLDDAIDDLRLDVAILADRMDQLDDTLTTLLTRPPGAAGPHVLSGPPRR